MSEGGKPLNVDDLWENLIKSKKQLLIATVITKDVAKSWAFVFRNKIIRYLVPKQVNIVNLEFDKLNCLEESKQSITKNSRQTIHGIMINNLLNLINDDSYCLLIDIDAFPLSKKAIKIAFATAFLKGVNGNIQRTNCLENNQHIFIAESFMCFYTKKVKHLGKKAWEANNRSDVSEEITWEWPELIDEFTFRPITTIMKPIWPLQGSEPKYGIGTTFGMGKIKISYHHFFARNLISRFHFFIITFFYYIKIRLKEKNKQQERKKKLNYLLTEIKFAFKYLMGKIS